MSWICSSAFTYREIPCNAVHLSSDSSILCLAYGPLITLWNPINLSLRTTLVSSVPMYPVTSLITLVVPKSHPLDRFLCFNL
jgi:hypothetical protein